jgi:sodium-dependent dicarboxylate transporter 2/3/5
MKTKAVAIILSLLFSGYLFLGTSLEPAIARGLVLFVLIACFWIFEIWDITVTALCVPLLAVVFGIFDVTTALSNFAHPIIFIFLGGFALAAALRTHNIDILIAEGVIKAARGKALISILMLFGITAFLSLWISNTATTVMMMPLALGLLKDLDGEADSSLCCFVLLGIAYSANIGGMGTLVGSPPNAIAAAQIQFAFIDWLKVGLPLVLILLPLMIVSLYLISKPRIPASVTFQVKDRSWDHKKSIVVGIFALTVVLWVFSAPLKAWLEVKGSLDAAIAILAIVLLTATRSVSWMDVQNHTNWGVLLLFGGGLCLSAALTKSGASQFLAEGLAAIASPLSMFMVLVMVITFVVFLTELVSNTASAAILVPLFLGVAHEMSFSPVVMLLGIGFAASCAFMLPVATPPNAVVFGSGKVAQKQMMKHGLVLNGIAIVVISIYLHLFVG